MIPEWLFAGAFLAGLLTGLGLVWRRLALVEHLEDVLSDLHSAGSEVCVSDLLLASYDPHAILPVEYRVKHLQSFNRRLLAARELLERIEKARR